MKSKLKTAFQFCAVCGILLMASVMAAKESPDSPSYNPPIRVVQ
jgi:hypothetical protein